ncbi:MAG: hypothetical protein GY787_29860 [Alteromonadales bacterium]|nr:hypothetical protein [Alteromonadales bacterium]
MQKQLVRGSQSGTPTTNSGSQKGSGLLDCSLVTNILQPNKHTKIITYKTATTTPDQESNIKTYNHSRFKYKLNIKCAVKNSHKKGLKMKVLVTIIGILLSISTFADPMDKYTHIFKKVAHNQYHNTTPKCQLVSWVFYAKASNNKINITQVTQEVFAFTTFSFSPYATTKYQIDNQLYIRKVSASCKNPVEIIIPPHTKPAANTITFNAKFYLEKYPDLRKAFGTNYESAYTHWKKYGIKEGRIASPSFDAKFYLKKYPDLRKHYGATNYEGAHLHWITHGIKAGRIGSPYFNVTEYLNRYSDLKAAFGAKGYEAAHNHWINYGIDEGRVSTPEFNVRYYLNRYPDLIAAFGSGNYKAAYYHWVNFGLKKGRVSSPSFSVTSYLNRYRDLQNAYGKSNYKAAFEHWFIFGKKAGRNSRH